jgi:hypothetical protein
MVMNDLHRNTHADKADVTSAEALGALGLSVFAYAKPAEVEGQRVFTIHAADGSHIGTAPSREHAHAAMIQHGLIPMSLH